MFCVPTEVDTRRINRNTDFPKIMLVKKRALQVATYEVLYIIARLRKSNEQAYFEHDMELDN